MRTELLSGLILALALILLAGCSGQLVLPTATPTVDPDIFNIVPATTVYEPGQCNAILEAAVPAYTSNTLGGQPSGEVPAGTYEVQVAADYGSSLWYQLSGAGEANFVNAASVTSTEGDCGM